MMLNSTENLFFILLYGYRLLFYPFILRLARIKRFSNINLMIGCISKLSFKLAFRRKKIKNN